MKLVLVRHGNTFGSNDKVVWVGARSDLPLTQTGREQARAVGLALKQVGGAPQKLLAGPLMRTMETAGIIAEVAGWNDLRVSVTDALREIDYGLWEGKSNEEIRAEYGSGDIDGWQKDSVWPTGCGWSPDPDAISRSWDAMVADIARSGGENASAVIVTSNGILRMIAGKYGIGALEAKVGTGHICIIEDNRAVVWNQNPAA